MPNPHDPLPETTPLVVDMDGTLVRTDTLIELLLVLARTKFLTLLHALLMLVTGSRSRFKAFIAVKAELNPAQLPYNETLLTYLRQQKSLGRRLVLATAAYESVAAAVATHLQLFDEILATTAALNLKGRNKAAALTERFGERGFVYAGDSRADVAVWKHAAAAIPVGNTKALAALVKIPIECEFVGGRVRIGLILRQMRIYQWVKNLLVFIPLIASGKLANLGDLRAAVITFFAFGLTASAVYILNDLLDIEADRQHHSKRKRPFASGALPLWSGLVLAPLLFVAGGAAAFSVSLELVMVLLGYAFLTTWYSVYLKAQPLVDVFALAALYSIRMLAGGIATGIMPSIWLLSFSGCLFLSLAFLKRYTETTKVEQAGTQLSRRGYYAGESEIQIIMGMAGSFSSVIVFAIWLDSEAFHHNYSNQLLIWLMAPLILLWQCRLWLSAFRGWMHDDPIVYTAKDRISWAIFTACGALYVLGRNF